MFMEVDAINERPSRHHLSGLRVEGSFSISPCGADSPGLSFQCGFLPPHSASFKLEGKSMPMKRSRSPWALSQWSLSLWCQTLGPLFQLTCLILQTVTLGFRALSASASPQLPFHYYHVKLQCHLKELAPFILKFFWGHPFPPARRNKSVSRIPLTKRTLLFLFPNLPGGGEIPSFTPHKKEADEIS